MNWRRIRYRLLQFWRGINAQVSEADLRQAAAVLPVAAFALFTQLPVDAQRHSLNVLVDLQRSGGATPDLAVAALLHDVGKLATAQAGIQISLWLRAPLVLIEQIPGLLRRLASERAQNGWHYALYVHSAHPQIGAQWAQERGCSELTCWLIEHHQDTLSASADEDAETFRQSTIGKEGERLRLLRLLQWADENN